MDVKRKIQRGVKTKMNEDIRQKLNANYETDLRNQDAKILRDSDELSDAFDHFDDFEIHF